MAPRLARVLTVGRVVGQTAGLDAGRTRAVVAAVRVVVVAGRSFAAGQVTFGGLRLPGPATRHFNDCARTTTLETGP